MKTLADLLKARNAIDAKIAAIEKAELFKNLKKGGIVTLKNINKDEMVKGIDGKYIYHRYVDNYGNERGFIEFNVLRVNKHTVAIKDGDGIYTIKKEYLRTAK